MTKQDGSRHVSNLKSRVKGWKTTTWGTLWAAYQAGISEQARSPAQQGDLQFDRKALHRGLAKVESSVLIQRRTEKIGLAHFLYNGRVPHIQLASCNCGWRKQNVKHVLMIITLVW